MEIVLILTVFNIKSSNILSLYAFFAVIIIAVVAAVVVIAAVVIVVVVYVSRR